MPWESPSESLNKSSFHCFYFYYTQFFDFIKLFMQKLYCG